MNFNHLIAIFFNVWATIFFAIWNNFWQVYLSVFPVHPERRNDLGAHHHSAPGNIQQGLEFLLLVSKLHLLSAPVIFELKKDIIFDIQHLKLNDQLIRNSITYFFHHSKDILNKFCCSFVNWRQKESNYIIISQNHLRSIVRVLKATFWN